MFLFCRLTSHGKINYQTWLDGQLHSKQRLCQEHGRRAQAAIGVHQIPEKGWLKEAVKDVKEWMPTVSEGNI